MKNCIIFIALAVLFYTSNAMPSYGNTGVSYGGNAGRIEVVKPMITLDTQTGYGGQQHQVIRPTLDIPMVQTGYGAQQQLIRPALDTVVQVQTLEPELRNLCLNRRENTGVFYLPHPSKQSWYIQCDEYGQAFLKECPAGTIFTQNLVCENINDLHPIEPVRPVISTSLDQTVGAYGSVPVFTAEAGSAISQARVEVIVEAPEFKGLCLNKNAYGAQVSTVFYVPHPSKQSSYIQCDEFGRAFLKECPAGTIFTQHLVCENINDLHTVQVHSVEAAPQLDQPIVPQYGAVNLAADVTRVEVVQEAPEFKELCMSKNTYGAQVSTVFYVAHPSNRGLYIQCDEFGRAFLRECPAGTIFTQNLVCENINDLHTVEPVRPVISTSLDQTVGAYGSAPVFAAEAGSAISQARVEVIVEAPEFKSLCLNSNAYGAQVSTVFYIAHPSNKGMYIQCDEFGRAFLKECPAGTIFTSRLTCEKVTEIVETQIMQDQIIQRPIMREQTSYGQVPVVNKIIETPIIQKTSYAQPIPEVPRPILRERPVTYTQTVVSTPILREQVVQPVSSYGQAQVMTRPILREQVVQQPSSYGQSLVRPAY